MVLSLIQKNTDVLDLFTLYQHDEVGALLSILYSEHGIHRN